MLSHPALSASGTDRTLHIRKRSTVAETRPTLVESIVTLVEIRPISNWSNETPNLAELNPSLTKHVPSLSEALRNWTR